MPICTHCTQYLPFLYTVYESAYNLRLEQCPSCNEFADPYVEHDALTLLIDLILLKRDVYRHLLFNRGLGRRKAVASKDTSGDGDTEREARVERSKWEKSQWFLILKLGCALVAVDAFIRWTHFYHPTYADLGSRAEEWNKLATSVFLRTFIACLIETIAFHAGITAGSFVVMSVLGYLRNLRFTSGQQTSGTRREFRYTQVPLTLLYSSLPKLFLLFLLSIWRPSATQPSSPNGLSLSSILPIPYDHPLIVEVNRLLQDPQFDREWVVRNVLGGMSAGFGLRVVVDCHPILTMTIILAGWGLKTGTASLLGGWVGRDQALSEAWRAYSIP